MPRSGSAILSMSGRRTAALAVHGEADGALDQGHARGAVLTVLGQMESARQSDGLPVRPLAGDHRIALGACNAGDGRGFRKGADQLRMVGGAVIALAVVLPDELPVRLFDDGGLERHLALVQVVRQEIRLDVSADRLEIRRDLGEAHTDVAADARAVHDMQSVLRAVESLTHVARREQASVEVICPLMVRTHQPRRRATLRRADPRAPMAARIVKGVQLAVAVADHHHGILSDLHRQIIARIRHFTIVADEQPIAVPDHLEIDSVLFLAAIKLTLEGGLVLASPQSIEDDLARAHRGSRLAVMFRTWKS